MNIASLSRYRPVLPWVRRAATLGALVFLWLVIKDNWRQVASEIKNIHLLTVATSLVLATMAFGAASMAWRSLLRGQGVVLSVRMAWWLYARTLLIRYVPGGVPGIAARVDTMHQLGIQAWHGTWNVVIEMAFAIWTGTLVFLISGWWGRIAPWLAWLCLLAVVVGALVFLGLGSARTVFTRLRERVKAPTIHLRTAGQVAAWHGLLWLLFGWSTHVLMLDLTASGGPWMITTGAFAGSWSLGLLAVVVPSGLGVREGAMITLLQPDIGSIAVTIAVLSRLMFTAGEVLNLAVAGSLRLRKGDT